MRNIALLVSVAALSLSGPSSANTGASAEGKILFEQKCAACHTIGGGKRVGPDLNGVADRRPREWLVRFITEPDRMIAEKDPVAIRLYEEYNRIAMSNLGLKESEALALIDHLRSESTAIAPAAAKQTAAATLPQPDLATPQSTILGVFLAMTAIIVLVFAWVGLSTRKPADVDVTRAYGIRKVFFIAAAVVLVALLFATIPNAPYAGAGVKAERIVYVAARQFDFVFSDEPIVGAADLGRVSTIGRLELPPGALVEFRVTSLDVNHGFGVYGPERQLLAQTQAMPGYVNRLLVRLAQSGQYKVFCLEYCAAGHHLMQSELTVK